MYVPATGQERVMKLSPEALAGADLEAIMVAIANSPIVVRRATLQALLADWENTRHSADVDEVILAWIASHVSARNPATLS
jgi:hypothetical protein